MVTENRPLQTGIAGRSIGDRLARVLPGNSSGKPTIRATGAPSPQEVASTGGRKTTNRPVRATAHDPVSLGARSPDDSARTLRNPTCTEPLTGPLDECEWKCGGAVFCPPVDATDHKEVDSGRPPHGRVMGPGDGHGGPANLMPQIGGLVEPGGGPGRGPTFSGHRRRAALVQGWTATFFTGAGGGGWSFSMLGLSRDR
jgi:hypothetical protein